MTNANNLQTIVEGPPPSAVVPPTHRDIRGWMRRWWWAIGAASLVSVVAAVIVASLLIHVPYVIESPGNLYATNDRISVSGATTYPTTDKIDLVTVSVDTRVSVIEKFIADHDGDDVVVPAKDVLGDQTPAQNDRLNELLMSQSKDAAVLVALKKLGYDVKPTPTGAVIEDVVKGAPADGAVNIADTIVAVDQSPINTGDDLHNVFSTHKPGDRVQLTLESIEGTRRTVDVTLADNPQSSGTPFLGVSLTTRLVYPDLAVKVTVASGQIGGPSAGLAFTLGILDTMTPGDLTAGHEVAATGTIDADGVVGPIGGIRGKVTAVSRHGVKYFLVPLEDYEEAKAHAPSGLQIVPVHTLDDALTFLSSLGGSGLPATPATSGQ